MYVKMLRKGEIRFNLKTVNKPFGSTMVHKWA